VTGDGFAHDARRCLVFIRWRFLRFHGSIVPQMRPSQLIFAFLAGGIAIALLSGEVHFAFLMAVFFALLVFSAITVSIFRGEQDPPEKPK